MAQVSVSISGRSYRMACDDGEEAHLEELAKQLDGKIAELRGHFGEIGDQRITVMAALTILDERSSAEDRIGALETRIAELEDGEASFETRLDGACAAVAETLTQMAARIERIARNLDSIRRD